MNISYINIFAHLRSLSSERREGMMTLGFISGETNSIVKSIIKIKLRKMASSKK
jgi:hypothetical protein